MANVLKASSVGATGVYAYLRPGAISEVYIQFQALWDTNALAAGAFFGYTPNVVEVYKTGYTANQGVLLLDAAGSEKFCLIDDASSPYGTASANTWYTIDLHIIAGSPHTAEFRVNGVTQGPPIESANVTDVYEIRIGLGGTDSDSRETVYLKNLKIGTTAFGSSDLLNNPLTTDLSGFTGSVVNAGDSLSFVADPNPGAPTTPEGVSIAFDDTMLEPDPTWTRIDNQVRVSRWEIRRGRQDEREKTEPAEVSVFINDVDGDLDPSNSGSTWFGKLDGKQISIARWNPISEDWWQRFRGTIEGYEYNLSSQQNYTQLVIRAVGFMAYEARAEMAPGAAGHAGGRAGTIFYDEQEVNDRINLIHSDAGIDPALYVTFSGNVVMQESVYDPGYSFLAGLFDAADAEFAGVSNVFEDRKGRICFHGRHARFQPDLVAADAGPDAWDFQRWKAGDGDAIAGDSDYAQIRPPLEYDRSLDRVINAALVTPFGIADADVAGQIVTDAVSIGKYGVRSYSAQDLRVLEHKTNGHTALEETFNQGSYYVTNYSEPLTRPRQITLRAIPPDDPRGTATWNLICGVDVSDIVHLKVTTPGGGGFDDDFYVEGITESSTPLGPFTPTGQEYDNATITLDVSPKAWYTDDTFGDDTPS